MATLDDAPLGRTSAVPADYAPELLFAVPRADGRAGLGLSGVLPFHGEDVWNAYEISWLGPGGRPEVRLGELRFACTSPNIVESKSLKLYLNSLNNTRFDDEAAIRRTLEKDLAAVSGAPVRVTLWPLDAGALPLVSALEGWNIDDAATTVERFDVDASLLDGAAGAGPELCATFTTDLFRSCCPVTGQPDWASVAIRYEGRWIDPAALLRYLVSFRNNAEFHEQCVERLFCDIKTRCGPRKLTVHARYTRRGGLDINPFRSDFEPVPANRRLARQ